MNYQDDDLQEIISDIRLLYNEEIRSIVRPLEDEASYYDLLMGRNKSELTDIRRCWELKNISHLNKAELAERLADLIPAHLEEWLILLNQEQCQFLAKIIESNGVIKIREANLRMVKFYLYRGVLFPGIINGEKFLVMPEELQGITAQFLADRQKREMIKKNDRLLTLVKGMLVYYGGMPYYFDFFELCTRYYPELEYAEFYSRINEYLYYNSEGVCINEGNFLFYYTIDPGYLMEEIDLRKDIEYYPLSLEDIEFAARRGLPKPNFEQRRLRKYLQKEYGLTEYEVEEICYDLIMSSNYGERFQERLDIIQDQIEFDGVEEVKVMIEYLTRFHNNTRQWVLKGHTPNELSGVDIDQLRPLPEEETGPRDFFRQEDGTLVRKEKVGRNDPCPCGSRKKYKHCCGR
ncbi:MAG: SEC-C metal-binding domain-containing protein [Halanaerobium sp.]|nr:SEC-C metal-binding domain-containing protein [Halanaerobium sp.]